MSHGIASTALEDGRVQLRAVRYLANSRRGGKPRSASGAVVSESTTQLVESETGSFCSSTLCRLGLLLIIAGFVVVLFMAGRALFLRSRAGGAGTTEASAGYLGADRKLHKCQLRESEPLLGPPRAVSPEPGNATILAQLAGYIRVYDAERLHARRTGYLPLDFKFATITEKYKTLSLHDECAGVTIGVSHHHDAKEQSGNSMVELENVNWFFKNDSKFDKQTKQSYVYCSSPLRLTFPLKYRYSNFKRQIYQCLKLIDGKLHGVAELVIESFELELGGNPELIKLGQFSKLPLQSSVSPRKTSN